MGTRSGESNIDTRRGRLVVHRGGEPAGVTRPDWRPMDRVNIPLISQLGAQDPVQPVITFSLNQQVASIDPLEHDHRGIKHGHTGIRHGHTSN